jgi:small subunit ribosomal protein S1
MDSQNEPKETVENKTTEPTSPVNPISAETPPEPTKTPDEVTASLEGAPVESTPKDTASSEGTPEPPPVAEAPTSVERSPLPTRPAEPKASSAPEALSVPLPTPEEDATLEEEIAAAMGDGSLMDIYDLDQAQAAAEAPAPKTPKEEKSLPPGVVRGKVVGITGEDIFIDLGGKSQGMLQRNELPEDAKVEKGDTIEVAIVGYDKQDGLILLSKKTAEQQLLRRDLKKGSMVEARVVGSNKGGLEMDIKGLKAFMPASQIGFDRIEDLNTLMNEVYTCAVIEVDRGDKNIVLSRRRILEKERHEKQELLWADIQKGQNRHGTVTRLAEFGAFVDIGGVDGLLHVSEMSWARVQDPKEILQVGQEIDVMVIDVDKVKQRVSLSLKLAGGDPWSTAQQNYAVGTRHQAQVTHLQDFGAFAELEPGLEGLIPISEMTWIGRIRHPKDVVQPGAKVEVEILRVDPDKRRISLSMKNLQENPWFNIAQKYIRSEIYTGKVVRLTDFGAFVTLEEGVDGLIHISELSNKHVNKTSDVVSVDQEVSVRVLKVDPDNQKISLSMKGIGPNGQEEVPEVRADDRRKPGTKKKARPRRGGLSSHHGESSIGLNL